MLTDILVQLAEEAAGASRTDNVYAWRACSSARAWPKCLVSLSHHAATQDEAAAASRFMGSNNVDLIRRSTDPPHSPAVHMHHRPMTGSPLRTHILRFSAGINSSVGSWSSGPSLRLVQTREAVNSHFLCMIRSGGSGHLSTSRGLVSAVDHGRSVGHGL